MMKWVGRKQPSSSSSWPRSQSPSISHAFPISWLSKLKQIGGNSERKPTKEKQKGRVNSESPGMACPTSGQDGRFYAGEDDSYWRLSFGEDKFEGERHRKGMKSVLYGSDEDVGLPFLDRQKCNSMAAEAAAGEEEIWKFNGMALEARKMGELPRNVEITTEIKTCEKEAKQRVGKELNKPRRKAAKHQKLRKISRRVAGQKGTDPEREPDKADRKIKIPVERDLSEPEPKPMKTIQTSEGDYQQATASNSRKHRHVSGMDSSNSNVGTIAADSAFEARNMGKTIAKFEKHSPEWQNGEEGRASMYISRKLQRRTKQSGNAGASSPRTATKIECKIKAIEDMKKAKIKMKKKSKSRAVEDRTGTVFDSFAVVKCSFDPQRDFKDSMVAMITEKGIEQPEELEELLACYLTLNSDEYHDLIIKVFRQVWFDLNRVNFRPELYHQHCCQA